MLYQPLPSFTIIYQHLPIFTMLYRHLPTVTNLYRPLPSFTICIVRLHVDIFILHFIKQSRQELKWTKLDSSILSILLKTFITQLLNDMVLQLDGFLPTTLLFIFHYVQVARKQAFCPSIFSCMCCLVTFCSFECFFRWLLRRPVIVLASWKWQLIPAGQMDWRTITVNYVSGPCPRDSSVMAIMSLMIGAYF